MCEFPEKVFSSMSYNQHVELHSNSSDFESPLNIAENRKEHVSVKRKLKKKLRKEKTYSITEHRYEINIDEANWKTQYNNDNGNLKKDSPKCIGGSEHNSRTEPLITKRSFRRLKVIPSVPNSIGQNSKKMTINDENQAEREFPEENVQSSEQRAKTEMQCYVHEQQCNKLGDKIEESKSSRDISNYSSPTSLHMYEVMGIDEQKFRKKYKSKMRKEIRKRYRRYVARNADARSSKIQPVPSSQQLYCLSTHQIRNYTPYYYKDIPVSDTNHFIDSMFENIHKKHDQRVEDDQTNTEYVPTSNLCKNCLEKAMSKNGTSDRKKNDTVVKIPEYRQEMLIKTSAVSITNNRCTQECQYTPYDENFNNTIRGKYEDIYCASKNKNKKHSSSVSCNEDCKTSGKICANKWNEYLKQNEEQNDSGKKDKKSAKNADKITEKNSDKNSKKKEAPPASGSSSASEPASHTDRGCNPLCPGTPQKSCREMGVSPPVPIADPVDCNEKVPDYSPLPKPQVRNQGVNPANNNSGNDNCNQPNSSAGPQPAPIGPGNLPRPINTPYLKLEQKGKGPTPPPGCQHPHDQLHKAFKQRYKGEVICIHNPPCVLINGCLNVTPQSQSPGQTQTPGHAHDGQPVTKVYSAMSQTMFIPAETAPSQARKFGLYDIYRKWKGSKHKTYTQHSAQAFSASVMGESILIGKNYDESTSANSNACYNEKQNLQPPWSCKHDDVEYTSTRNISIQANPANNYDNYFVHLPMYCSHTFNANTNMDEPTRDSSEQRHICSEIVLCTKEYIKENANVQVSPTLSRKSEVNYCVHVPLCKNVPQCFVNNVILENENKTVYPAHLKANNKDGPQVYIIKERKASETKSNDKTQLQSLSNVSLLPCNKCHKHNIVPQCKKCHQGPQFKRKYISLTAKQTIGTQVKPKMKMVCRHEPPCVMIPKCLIKSVADPLPYEAMPQCPHKPICDLVPACCRSTYKKMVTNSRIEITSSILSLLLSSPNISSSEKSPKLVVRKPYKKRFRLK